MKTIILILLCIYLYAFIKPLWKAFVIGIVCNILVSFLIMVATVPTQAKLNITLHTFSIFAGEEFVNFLFNFLIGIVIFKIFSKFKKPDQDLIESIDNKDSEDNPQI